MDGEEVEVEVGAGVEGAVKQGGGGRTEKSWKGA